MVKFEDTKLDRIFAALADPTRRALLARLTKEECLSVSELAEPFAVSLPAIMKHLDVLLEAGLISRTKTGRTVACQLNAAPMEQAAAWLFNYQEFWSDRRGRPEGPDEVASLNSSARPIVTQIADTAPPSNVVSMRRRKKALLSGPTRKK